MKGKMKGILEGVTRTKDRRLRVRKADDAVRSWRWRRQLVPALVLVALGYVILNVISYMILFRPALWDWMKGSNGVALRNFALVAAAAIGLLLAVWRSLVAHKQADTAERGHNNERYQKGADMLGSGVMTTRMGGVYALERLAQEHPREYHVQIMKLLCAFLRHRVKDRGEEAKAESKKLWLNLDATAHGPPGGGGILARKELQSDLNAAAQTIGECRRGLAKTRLFKSIEGDFNLDFRDMNLSGANLSRADLTGANLSRANIEDVSFEKVNGLSHEQLDMACQHPDGRPPMYLRDDLTWDEEAAIARWHKWYGSKSQR